MTQKAPQPKTLMRRQFNSHFNIIWDARYNCVLTESLIPVCQISRVKERPDTELNFPDIKFFKMEYLTKPSSSSQFHLSISFKMRCKRENGVTVDFITHKECRSNINVSTVRKKQTFLPFFYCLVSRRHFSVLFHWFSF